ncbi:hypothetical protein UlMin_004427, partial [Ulmus minor]
MDPISLCALVLLTFSGFAASQNTVANLPGFEGDLPFKLETGYVGVGESNEIQLFYYFVESHRSPTKDPLMIWQSGGPGASAQTALFYEHGPLGFTTADYKGSLPSLRLNPYALTQRVNILYVDVPVGTGFSYSTTQEGYYTDDLKSAADTTQFIRKWLIDHPQYLTNALYIAGESYAGKPVPIIVQNIHKDNEAGLEPYLNLRGYLLPNPLTDTIIDGNSPIPFAHRMTLIPDELYESAKESCNGNYINVDERNTRCVAVIAAIDQLLLYINTRHILEPTCQPASPRLGGNQKRSLQQYYDSENILPLKPRSHSSWCRDRIDDIHKVWVNDKSVQKALNVREGTIGVFERVNKTIVLRTYRMNVASTVEYHRHGDHDMLIPHIGTQNWIRSLNLKASEIWRAWFVDGQVAG